MSEEIIDEVVDDVEETEDEVELVDVDDTDDAVDEYSNLTQEEAVERLKKAEKAIIKHKKSPATPKDEKKEEIIKESEPTRLERIELRQDGYPDEIVDSIMDLGGRTALKNPILKKAVDDMVTQHKAENASAIKGGPNSSVATKYSKEDLDNMSVEELEKVLPHAD